MAMERVRPGLGDEQVEFEGDLGGGFEGQLIFHFLTEGGRLVKGEDASALAGEDRERLEVMAGVSAFPMRVKCATLAWHTMKSALEGGETARTE